MYPELDITNYTGIPAEAVSSEVSDAEVETTLKKLQEDMSELAPVEEERPVKQGDFVEISFHGNVRSARKSRCSPKRPPSKSAARRRLRSSRKTSPERRSTTKRLSASPIAKTIRKSGWPARPSTTRSKSKRSRRRRFPNSTTNSRRGSASIQDARRASLEDPAGHGKAQARTCERTDAREAARVA